MPGIENKDIGPLWAEHYPKWRQSPESKGICLTISAMVKDQAAQLIARTDWTTKMNVTLASYNIPKHEFNEFAANFDLA